ncbi:MAG: HK97 family phage prohead protease [Acidobacteria bacterium]|nr:HK97 family phage prohead protease [Acidobacteriota bacterium]MCA1650801.1 HK97 family phage prohead protease [Acidobacteriota bacterium]
MLAEPAAPAFVGYAVEWARAFTRADRTESFQPGAFSRSIERRLSVPCVFAGSHVGNLRDGSLTLTENAHGLHMQLQPWDVLPGVLALLHAACAEPLGLVLRYRVREAAWSLPPVRHRTVLNAELCAVHVRAGARLASGWLAPQTKYWTWRATSADLEARDRDIEDELAELEAMV